MSTSQLEQGRTNGQGVFTATAAFGANSYNNGDLPTAGLTMSYGMGIHDRVDVKINTNLLAVSFDGKVMLTKRTSPFALSLGLSVFPYSSSVNDGFVAIVSPNLFTSYYMDYYCLNFSYSRMILPSSQFIESGYNNLSFSFITNRDVDDENYWFDGGFQFGYMDYEKPTFSLSFGLILNFDLTKKPKKKSTRVEFAIL
jgi:hypothetical protein